MSIARKILMGSSGGKKSTYVDDVFSTYLYKGTGSPQTITNGIDLAGEGGMTWIKSRNWTRSHNVYDTVRGTNKVIYTESTLAEVTKGPANQDSGIYQFNNNGFNIGAINGVGANGYDYSSWTFRKTPGFFDVVTYTGNGTAGRTVAHNLGSVPGMVIIKKRTSNGFWGVGHRSLDYTAGDYLQLNSDVAVAQHIVMWNDTAPTSTHVTLGTSSTLNTNGEEYVMYLFAGGASTAATARSVDFDGSDDYLALGNSSDLSPEGGDFTFECWIKPDSWTTGNWDAIYVNTVVDGFYVGHTNANVFVVRAYYTANYIETSNLPPIGQWTHVAVTRSGSTLRLFYNGILEKSVTNSTSFATGNTKIANDEYGSTFDGDISNLRFVKGTAVYTSSFRPPTEPLTNITNTKLLCCNNSSITGSTVAPATITSGGGPTASSDSPFDDPEGYKFGEDGDQNIIKCGTYDGNPNSANIDVEIGWEPQFFMVKSATASSTEWLMWDSMRGVVTNYNDARLSPTNTSAEYGGQNAIDFTSTGVRIRDGDARVNGGNGQKLIYIAIRRPDGYVGKPAEAGTDAFAMDTGNTSSTIPNFDSGFPVDFAYMKTPASGGDWYTGARLLGERYVKTNNNDADADWGGGFDWDSNVGWLQSSATSAWQSWMWKRGAGFDVVTYTGNGTGGTRISHSLNKSPEMIWIKNRTTGNNTGDWMVGHKDLYAGSSPWNGYLVLNKAQQEYADQKPFYNVSPTSTVFTLDGWDRVNHNGSSYIAFLFASVAGISKVGSYTGSSSELTITTGFQPRFVIIKNRTNTGNNWTTGWFTFDTTRGWAAGNNDKRMRLNDTAAQSTEDWTNPISTGFTIDSGNQLNNNGEGYIYYAHA